MYLFCTIHTLFCMFEKNHCISQNMSINIVWCMMNVSNRTFFVIWWNYHRSRFLLFVRLLRIVRSTGDKMELFIKISGFFFHLFTNLELWFLGFTKRQEQFSIFLVGTQWSAAAHRLRIISESSKVFLIVTWRFKWLVDW